MNNNECILGYLTKDKTDTKYPQYDGSAEVIQDLSMDLVIGKKIIYGEYGFPDRTMPRVSEVLLNNISHRIVSLRLVPNVPEHPELVAIVGDVVTMGPFGFVVQEELPRNDGTVNIGFGLRGTQVWENGVRRVTEVFAFDWIGQEEAIVPKIPQTDVGHVMHVGEDEWRLLSRHNELLPSEVLGYLRDGMMVRVSYFCMKLDSNNNLVKFVNGGWVTTEFDDIDFPNKNDFRIYGLVRSGTALEQKTNKVEEIIKNDWTLDHTVKVESFVDCIVELKQSGQVMYGTDGTFYTISVSGTLMKMMDGKWVAVQTMFPSNFKDGHVEFYRSATWEDNIPPNGVLCWILDPVIASGTKVAIIVSKCDDGRLRGSEGCRYVMVTPLTPDEITKYYINK